MNFFITIFNLPYSLTMGLIGGYLIFRTYFKNEWNSEKQVSEFINYWIEKSNKIHGFWTDFLNAIIWALVIAELISRVEFGGIEVSDFI